jgi:hypothetical protein
LLAESRDVRKSLTTRVFQHFVLGCQAFRETFGLPCEMESPSYLRLYDRPLLDPGLREEVLRRWQGGRLDLAAYTARPCRLRGEAGAPILPYSPEADVVLDACGLKSLPLVGYGQVYRLAELTGSTSDHFVKPSVVQALGAIGAAVWREEMPAMLAAERWINHHEDGRFTGLPGLEIFIFEDSAGSMRAVQHAAELLQSIGVAAQVRAFGVARSPAKVAALRAAGAQIFMDVNQAVAEALKLVQS